MQLVPPILKELAVDGVVVDQAIAGGGTAAERAGLPFVTVCTAPPWNEDPAAARRSLPGPIEDGRRARLRNRLGYAGWRWFMRPTLQVVNRYRKAWGCPASADGRLLFLSGPDFPALSRSSIFPAARCRHCFHYVGSLAADRQ